jgi:hypothetical protein
MLAQWRKGAKVLLCSSFASLRLCARTLLLFILNAGSFIWFLGERFAGDAILTFNPPAEIDELAPLRAERTKRIFFPLDRFTAGWAFHQS